MDEEITFTNYSSTSLDSLNSADYGSYPSDGGVPAVDGVGYEGSYQPGEWAGGGVEDYGSYPSGGGVPEVDGTQSDGDTSVVPVRTDAEEGVPEVDGTQEHTAEQWRKALGLVKEPPNQSFAPSTGADAAIAKRDEANAGKDRGNQQSDLAKLLDSKMGAGIATSLVSGLLGGIGSGATAKANNKAQSQMLDQKYQQQLDYLAKTRGAGTLRRENWKPILSNGLLGQK